MLQDCGARLKLGLAKRTKLQDDTTGIATDVGINQCPRQQPQSKNRTPSTHPKDIWLFYMVTSKHSLKKLAILKCT